MMRRFLCSLLLLLAVPALAQRKPPIVGDALCVSQHDGPLLALSPALRDAYFAAMADMGWRLLRTDFTWSRIQPAPPPAASDFAPYDAIVDGTAAKGLGVLGVLGHGVDWAAGAASASDDRHPPDDPSTFATFAKETAQRYRGRVRGWEVWNEPNDGMGSWKPAADPAAYAALARAAARALTKADPKATIVTGGLAPAIDVAVSGRDYSFFTDTTRALRKWHRKFDAAAIHPYTFRQAPPPEEDDAPLAPSVDHQIRNFRDRLTESRATRLPVWLTELGWHTAADSGVPGYPPGVSEDDQARHLVRGIVLALSERAERVCWPALLDGADAATNKDAAFGLFRHQPTPDPAALDPKPAVQAAKTLARVLGATRFVKDLRVEQLLPNDAYAMCFQSKKPRQTVIVFWATRDGLETKRAIGGVKRARLIDMNGTETTIGDDEDFVDLTLGPTPVYLVTDEE